jgi:hypothetical protein
MKIKYFYIQLLLIAGFFLMEACNPPREAGIRDRAGNELSEFRSWVSNTVSRADDATEDERATIRQEFSQLSSRVAEGLNNLSESARSEFNQLTARYEEWDAEQDRKMARQQTGTATDQASQMTEKLLNSEYRDVNAINADQMHQAYQSLMQQVRDNHQNWTEEEWRQAEQVIERLNARQDQVASSLSAEDKTRIAIMRAEFRAIKAGEEVEPVRRN